MEFCAKCGVSGEEVKLFDGIDISEPIKICERCAFLDNVPLIKNPSTGQLRESERSGVVYNRLKKISGIEQEKEKKSFFEELKEIELNSKVSDIEKLQQRPLLLIDNFHWIIKRERRRRGLNQKQLAEAIGESEMAIKLIERNSLPEDAKIVIRKIEQYFRIPLIRKTAEQKKAEMEKKLLQQEEQKAHEIMDQSYEEIILPEHRVMDLTDADSLSEIDLHAMEAEGEEMVKEAIKTEPIEIRKHETFDKEHNQPLRVLDFKKERLDRVTISDLQEIQRVIEKDFPTKTSKQIGEEQLADFGKDEVLEIPDAVNPDLAKKKWFNKYVEKKTNVPEKINSGQGLSGKVPSLYELAERKKERDKQELGLEGEGSEELVGDDIELVD
jgi:ribosome-binding protein aMBF1 (putative translation factor)